MKKDVKKNEILRVENKQIMNHEGAIEVKDIGRSQGERDEMMRQYQLNLELTDPDEDLPDRARKNKFYLFFYNICMHDLFTFSMTAAIFINTLVLAFDKYPITFNT